MSKRKAKPGREQLVVLLADDSPSMRGDKATAATLGIREMIYQCQKKSKSQSNFRLSIAFFGGTCHWWCDDRPCLEVDRDSFTLTGENRGTDIGGVFNLAYPRIQQELAHIEDCVRPDRHPLPLIIIFSDGLPNYVEGRPDQFHSSQHAIDCANRVKRSAAAPLAVLVATAGITLPGEEYGQQVLREVASTPGCHLQISDLAILKRFLASTGSSTASSSAELEKIIYDLQPPGIPHDSTPPRLPRQSQDLLDHVVDGTTIQYTDDDESDDDDGGSFGISDLPMRPSDD